MSEHCHHQLLICGCGLLDSTVIIHCIAIDQSCSILQFIQCSTTAGTANASGYSDTDYPVLGSSLPALGDMPPALLIGWSPLDHQNMPHPSYGDGNMESTVWTAIE